VGEQQLATRYLDERASTLLAQVPSKHTAPMQTRSLPPVTSDQGQRPAPAQEATSASSPTVPAEAAHG
jgi:hypothetical protein